MAKFCPECGTPVGNGKPAKATATGSPISATPHVPKHLAEKILNSRSAVEGERKLVTVLFADLKGSMEIIADRDPEEAQRILDPLVSRMTEAVHYYEGTVSLLLGDGLMAIFGAPVAHEDHALRACYAGLRIQESTAKFADEIRTKLGVEPSVRVGLNSGDVVVRSIGTDLKMDYSAIGHTAHLASRMEQMAEAGSILMTPSTKRLVEGYVNINALGEKPVKGLSNPIEVFEVLGVSAVRSRLGASVARGLTSFLGRDVELELIRQGLDIVREGNGQAIAISGEAGIGKSRLIWEFTHSAYVDNCLVLEGQSSAYGKTASYAPVVDMLKDYLSIEKMDVPSDVRENVQARIAKLDTGLTPFLPAINALLGVSEDSESWAKRDPQSRRRQIIDGLRSLMLAESRHQPVVLIFDDLHWIDAETQALLDVLIDSLPMGRILLICGYRPEFTHSWSNRSYFRELRIAPLATSSTELLLNNLLGGEAKLQPLKQLLIDRTDGNPFFIEESVRTLVDMKFVDGSPGMYRLLKAAESINIPESTRAILSARIDRLDEDDKWILQAASVIGKDVPFTLLCAISELSEDELRDSLARLQALEFLYETSLFPELKYTFRHALVQEVAYGSLLSDRRRALHATIVRSAEQTEEERTLEWLDQIVQHAVNAELWDKAVDYAREAGRRAIGETALREASGYFQVALSALKNMPSDDASQSLAIDLEFDQRTVLIPLGSLDKAKQCLQNALATANDIGDRRRRGLANGYLANLYWELGEQTRAIEAGREAEQIAELLGDEGMANSARRYLGRSYLAVGEFETSLRMLEQCLPDDDLNGGGAASPSSVLVRVFMSASHAELGDYEKGLSFAETTIEIAKDLKHPMSSSAALAALGRMRLRRGEFDRAAEQLEEAVQIIQKEDIPLLFPFAAAPLGITQAWLGRTEDGIQLLLDAIDQSAEMSRMVDAALWHYWLAQAYSLAGQGPRAKQAAERGLSFSITYGERGHQAWLLRMIGDLELRADKPDLDKARRTIEDALSMAEDLSMRPLALRCHAGLAELYSLLGRADKEQDARDAAKVLGEQMEVAFWLDNPSQPTVTVSAGLH